MHFTPPAAQWGGYKMYHGAAPNGGGTNVNQYTLIYDVYYPAGSDDTWRSLLQTDVSNTSDGDLFVNPSDGIGISGIYDGSVSAGAWHRLAFAMDLTGTETGTATTPVIAKFIDGVKVGNQTAGLDFGKDGRWSLGPYALLFADNDGDVAEAYVSSVQFSNGRRPDAFIEALGGPSAFKIPGAIKAGVTNGAVTIMWTGGVPLQSADAHHRAVDNGGWDRRPFHLHAFPLEHGEVLSPADTVSGELSRFGGSDPPNRTTLKGHGIIHNAVSNCWFGCGVPDGSE